MAQLHRYAPNSDKTGYYLQDSVDETDITYRISKECEEILLSFGYEDEEPISDEILYVLCELGFIDTNNSVNKKGRRFDSTLELDDGGGSGSGGGDLSEMDRHEFLNIVLKKFEMNKTMRNKLERYADAYGIEIENDTNTDSSQSKRDTGWDSVEHTNGDSGERAIIASNVISKEALDGNCEHVEPHLLCKFCDTSHTATELLGHIAYSDDDSHGASGEVPSGFHPATAPVIEEGTIHVAFPATLRTNVNFHPVCRWCGKKFYRIDEYLDHMSGDQDSFDEDLHPGNKQSQIPLLVPFDRDGTVVPTTPPLSELTENTALEHISAMGNTVSNDQTQSDDMNSDDTDLSVRSGSERKNKMNGNISSNSTDASQMDTDETPHSDVTGAKEHGPTTSDATDIDSGAAVTNTSVKEDTETRVSTKTSETSDEETVQIDSVLVALVDLTVADDTNDYESRTDILDTALDAFLGAAIAGDQTSFDRQITTSRRFDIETDSVLGSVLTKTVQNEAQFDSSEEFIQHTVFDALGIDSSTTTIDIPNYDRYAFVIERLIQIEDCPYDAPRHIVRAALDSHLEIPNKD